MAFKNNWEKIGEAIQDYWTKITLAILALSLGVIKIFFSDSNIMIGLVILIVIGNIVILFYDLSQQKRLSALQKEISELDSEKKKLQESNERWKNGFDDFFRNSLIFLYNSLGYTERERILVYRHEDNRFILIGRYSRNPKFNNKGRDSYPDNEGFIAKGWEEGDFCFGILPDPNEDFESYTSQVMAYCTIKKGTIRNLNMLSRSYCINSINKSVTQEKIGLVVLESVDPGKFNPSESESAANRMGELFNSYIACKENC